MNVPLAKQRAEREKPFYRRIALGLKVVALIYLSILVYLMYTEERMVFPGASTELGDWTHAGIDLEEVELTSKGGNKVYGYFLPTDQTDTVLLFCHGNAENIALLAPEANQLRSLLGASVFVFDYRGYGKSLGDPNESGVLADAEAASEWLAQRTQQPAENFVLLGRSLGGGVAVHLASRNQAKGLILDRTFSSTVDVAASRYWWLPIRFFMRNQFLSIAKIRHYEGPILQLHGDVDEVIPFWSGRRLFDIATSEEKEFVEEPGLTHRVPIPDSFLQKMRDTVIRWNTTPATTVSHDLSSKFE